MNSANFKKNLIGRSVIMLLLFFAGGGISYAQSAEISGLTVYMEISSSSGASFSDTLIAADQSVNGTMVIEITNAANISKIHVKMGSTDGGNDLFARVFDFDVSNNLSSGTSYRREGNVIYLGIGSFTGLNHFFAEAKLEDAQGTIGNTIKYVQ